MFAVVSETVSRSSQPVMPPFHACGRPEWRVGRPLFVSPSMTRMCQVNRGEVSYCIGWSSKKGNTCQMPLASCASTTGPQHTRPDFSSVERQRSIVLACCLITKSAFWWVVGHGSFCAWKYVDSSREADRKFARSSRPNRA